MEVGAFAHDLTDFRRLTRIREVIVLLIVLEVSVVIICSDRVHAPAAASKNAQFNDHEQDDPEEYDMHEHPEVVRWSVCLMHLVSLDRVTLRLCVLASEYVEGFEYVGIEHHR